MFESSRRYPDSGLFSAEQNLEALLPEMEQLRAVANTLHEAEMELDKLEDRLQSRGLANEVPNVQNIIDKIKSKGA